MSHHEPDEGPKCGTTPGCDGQCCKRAEGRLTVDTITSDQLDALQLKAARMEHAVAEYATLRVQLEDTERERDGAYRERAHLLALLAATTPYAVIAPALDVEERGWQIVYLAIGGRQASWHISPRDADLFAAVEPVDQDDPRAQWDGHTTDEKYAWIAAHTAELMARCGPECSEMHRGGFRCRP